MGSKLTKSAKAQPASLLPDQDLWRAFKGGDRRAFSHIYRSHIQPLYNYGMKVAEEAELVEDCIQELFIYLWKTRENLGDTDSIKFYLFKALRRRIVTSQEESVRQSKKKVSASESQDAAEYSHEQFLVSRQLEEEQQQQLQLSLNALTKRQREAITLRFYDNLSFQEVAEVMSLNIKSTYNLVSKALDALKEKSGALLSY
ncbi:MAG: RNA polymerase sigma factor [Adhaeribacter sp.]